MPRTELLSVGNELLSGRTLNTNAQWLCKQLFELGIRVNRITTVGDDLDEISGAVKEALGRGTSLLITTGGLGPTYDDMTVEGVAKALEVELLEHPLALQLVTEKYAKLAARGREIPITQARRKMALLPKGAAPLANPVGTAPGVLLEGPSYVIICLPGVPDEMKAIFEGHIRSLLTSRFKGPSISVKRAVLVGIMESTLAPLIDIVRSESPSVYIKSHPNRSELEGPLIELEVQGEEEEAERALRALLQLAEKEGGRVVGEAGGT